MKDDYFGDFICACQVLTVYFFYLYFKFKIPSEFLVDEDETVERETLNSVRKLFSAGCLDPTPFGTKSFAEITADC